MDKKQLVKLIDSRIDKKISKIKAVFEEQKKEKLKQDSISYVTDFFKKRRKK